jgi:hypothetical protein
MTKEKLTGTAAANLEKNCRRFKIWRRYKVRGIYNPRPRRKYSLLFFQKKCICRHTSPSPPLRLRGKQSYFHYRPQNFPLQKISASQY